MSNPPNWFEPALAKALSPVHASLREIRDSMTARLDAVEVAVKSRDRQIEALLARVDTLERKVVFLDDDRVQTQANNRRNNVIITGIPEVDKETWDVTEKMALDVLQKHMGLTDLRVERAHRLGEPGERDRKIIVKFCFYKDRDRVLAGRGGLKGTDVYVDEDFPREVRIRRDALRRAIREAGVRKDGERIHLRFPFADARVGDRKYILDGEELKELDKGERVVTKQWASVVRTSTRAPTHRTVGRPVTATRGSHRPSASRVAAGERTTQSGKRNASSSTGSSPAAKKSNGTPSTGTQRTMDDFVTTQLDGTAPLDSPRPGWADAEEEFPID